MRAARRERHGAVGWLTRSPMSRRGTVLSATKAAKRIPSCVVATMQSCCTAVWIVARFSAFACSTRSAYDHIPWMGGAAKPKKADVVRGSRRPSVFACGS